MHPLLVLFALVVPSSPKLLNSRIINGDQAAKGQFPWQASLEITKNGASTWCGGALISDRWVLTAGHCVYGATHFVVRLGSVKLTQSDSDRVVVTTIQYVLHENYNSGLDNDVGLVFLPKSVRLSDNIQRVSLAESALPTGSIVTASGWGLTSDSEDKPSPLLHYVSLITISDSDCSSAYGNQLPKGAFCAQQLGSLVQATCEGDSGGPVVSNNVHVGIVSFGSSEGCESGRPVAFARTDLYRRWIRENTGV